MSPSANPTSRSDDGFGRQRVGRPWEGLGGRRSTATPAQRWGHFRPDPGDHLLSQVVARVPELHATLTIAEDSVRWPVTKPALGGLEQLVDW